MASCRHTHAFRQPESQRRHPVPKAKPPENKTMPGKTALLLAALLSATHAAAEIVQTEYDIRRRCSERHFAQTEVRDCVRRAAEISAANLRQAQRQATAKIRAWNEDRRYVLAAQQKLKAAEHSFATYRQNHCSWAASLGGGAIGTANEMRRNACIAETNNRRAEELRGIMQHWPF